MVMTKWALMVRLKCSAAAGCLLLQHAHGMPMTDERTKLDCRFYRRVS